MTVVSSRTFYTEQVNNVTVVSFTVSSFVETSYEAVSDELFELVEYVVTSGPIQVVLDLCSVHEIDDWGLAMLRAFHESIDSHGGTAIFCRLPQPVETAIREAGMWDAFHCRETRGEAIRLF